MGPEHKRLFQAYVSELTSAKKAALASAPPEPPSGAKRPVPAAADPRVLGTVTKYFFACQRLNEELERKSSEHFVYPHVFVHEMLTGQQQELWEFLAELPYLPLGLKPDGAWV